MSENWLTVSKKFIKEDREYRIANNWPLIPISEIKEYYNKYNKLVKDGSMLYIETPKKKSITTGPFEFDNIINIIFSKNIKLENNNTNGYVIAGGYICNLLLGKSLSDIDIDIFFYGSDEIAKKNVEILLNKLKPKIKHIERNDFIINIIYTNNEETYSLQIILKIYPNKSSIIGTFDLGASSALYDSKEILLTPMGVFSFATRCNYVDTTKGSYTYENRLVKYHINKEFRIAFPQLNPNKINIDELANYAKDTDKHFLKIFHLIQTQDIINDNISFYGPSISDFKKSIYFLVKNQLEKIAFKFDKNNSNYEIDCEFYKDNLIDIYSDKIPENHHSILRIKNFYPSDVFYEILKSFSFSNKENTEKIRDKYVDELINKIEIYVSYLNTLGIKFNNKSPIIYDPIHSKDWYPVDGYNMSADEIREESAFIKEILEKNS